MSAELPEKLRQRMIQVDNECMSKLAPQFKGNVVPIGSQWDYGAAIAQARLDFKQFIYPSFDIESAYQIACAKLREYIAKKNQRYAKDYMLVRDKDHGQDKLKFDRDMYLRCVKISQDNF